MSRRIVVVVGHPDGDERRLCRALAAAYADGARGAGHEVRIIDVAALEFPLLRSAEEFNHGEPVPCIRQAQDTIAWANHLFIIYPLWMGTMPALFKAFLEQVLRPGFAADPSGADRLPQKRLSGRSARIVVTMGMPALFYRWFYRAHGLKNLKRNILAFCGIRPVRTTLLGMVENVGDARRGRWFARMRRLGQGAV